MKTNPNFFNFVEMLKLEHNEVNNIAAQDFTLDELDELEKLLYILGKGYDIDDIETMHKDYLWNRNQYKLSLENTPLEELDNADWLDEQFFTLKHTIENMAAALVFDYRGFFCEARR